MTDQETPCASDQLTDLKATVVDGIKAVASTMGEAIEEGEKARQAPRHTKQAYA
ncbi:hypothetical protein [Tardiphaga sp. P9-11]|uniref:hypothetical protein n=1 Tax=Tardiphaga sp. P9-11 TaxID=2024614 RepID=UPI001562AF88|nr:hypothetical protein [Tardiphaga sp. P9-11]